MINIRKLVVADAPRASKLFADAFPVSSPHSWGRALGFEQSGLTGYFSSYIPETIQSELGIYGAWLQKESSEDEQLVGAIILEPFGHDQDKDLDIQLVVESLPHQKSLTKIPFTQPYDAIGGLLDACNDVFYRELSRRNVEEFQKLLTKTAQSGYVAWIATEEAYRRQYGVASRLIQSACDLMRSDPFQYSMAVAYCVSPVATKTFEKNGFEVWGQIEYQSFVMKNSEGVDCYPYQILPDEVSILVRCLR